MCLLFYCRKASEDWSFGHCFSVESDRVASCVRVNALPNFTCSLLKEGEEEGKKLLCTLALFIIRNNFGVKVLWRRRWGPQLQLQWVEVGGGRRESATTLLLLLRRWPQSAATHSLTRVLWVRGWNLSFSWLAHRARTHAMCWHFALYRTLIGVGRPSDGHGSTPFDVAIPTKVFPITDLRAKGHRNAFSRADGHAMRPPDPLSPSLPPLSTSPSFLPPVSLSLSLFYCLDRHWDFFFFLFLPPFFRLLLPWRKIFQAETWPRSFWCPALAPPPLPPQGVPITCEFILQSSGATDPCSLYLTFSF